MLSATLIKFLPRGAHNFWYTEGCSEDWYINLLYYNNYQKDRCLGQSWYLAVEMQCFIITPIIIILMYWKPLVGNLFTGNDINIALLIEHSINLTKVPRSNYMK